MNDPMNLEKNLSVDKAQDLVLVIKERFARGWQVLDSANGQQQ